MKRRFESKWANRTAQAGITLAAATLFLCIRPDNFAHARDTVEANYQQKVLTPKIIAEYLRKTPKPKIQIGAGPSKAAGWLNTDVEPTPGQAYLDATKRIGSSRQAEQFGW